MPTGPSTSAADGLVRSAIRKQLCRAPTVAALGDLLDAHEPRVEPKWIEP